MKRNESNADRILRAVLGVALVGGGLLIGGWVALVLYVVAAVLLFTAATGFCPLYRLLGIDTCRMSRTCAQ
jgi:uncharacterized membrane protein